MARHSERTHRWLWVVPSLVIPIAVAAVAWAIHLSNEGHQVAPNVRFAGLDISGISADDATVEVGERASVVLATPVTFDLGNRKVTMSAEELGYEYMSGPTVSAILEARHEGGIWDEFSSWITTPFRAHSVPDNVALDLDVARERLSTEDFVITEPVEPVLTNEGSSHVYVIPGVPGVGVNVDQVLDALAAADVTNGPIEVPSSYTGISPILSDAEVEAMADEVNQRTSEGMLAVVGEYAANIEPRLIRNHLMVGVEDGALELGMDMDGFQNEIESVFTQPIGDFVPPVVEIVDGRPVIRSVGVPAPVCCSSDSVRAAADQLLNGGAAFYQLQTRADDDETMLAWADGSTITEPISTFTTNHPCCESRVTNIQKIADALTGVYLIPGETLSVNEYVGPRTREKGYVGAGAIRSGHMTEEVGGGVSQFITTLFNAAFYGGLDLDVYQSHSIYFSRYPFGREATLSNPNPDLQLTNSTEFPVLIWPTYDATSITVMLYSTKSVEVEELDQRISKRNQCTHSEIDRRRTFSDGRVEIDTIVANYRPGDGLDCNGKPIPQT